MARFTRTDLDSSKPTATPARLYGDHVNVGEPVQIQGDAELRQQIESSLEQIARTRLLEAEAEATELIEQARAEATSILEKANAQAREMLETVQGQVDGIQESAHEAGFKAGFEEGYQDATVQVQQETERLLAGAQILAQNAYEAERRILKEFDRHALQLVEHVVRRILHKELSDSPEVLLGMIDQAISNLYLSGKVRVVVSSQIIQDLRQFSAQTEAALGAMSRYEFVADPALDLHQVYITAAEGSFELTPETQARQLLEPLQKELNLPRPEATPREVVSVSREPDAEPDNGAEEFERVAEEPEAGPPGEDLA